MIRHLLNYIWRQYKLVVRFFVVNNKSGLDKEFDKLVADKGIKVIESPPDAYSPNGTIKHAGGVLINQATALKLEGNLPDNIIAEYYIAAGYLLNRALIQRIRYRLLLRGFYKEIGYID